MTTDVLICSSAVNTVAKIMSGNQLNPIYVVLNFEPFVEEYIFL